VRTFFSSGFVTVSASLLRAFRICEAATLVEVFSKAWSSVRYELIVVETLDSMMPSRSCPVRWRKDVAEFMTVGNAIVGGTTADHRMGETARAEQKTGSLSNTLEWVIRSVLDSCRSACPGAVEML
jgi:hypothetical protein